MMKTSKLTKHLAGQYRTGVATLRTLGVCWATMAGIACTNLGQAAPYEGDQLVIGDTAEIAGGTAATWARVNGAGKVIWVGLTIPISMVEYMPPRGTGPAGAVAALNFPPVVQATTYFDHVQIQSQLTGHPNGGADPNRYLTPHFDFHFMGIPVAEVWAIPGGNFAAQVPSARLPRGYLQPESHSLPQMGRHSVALDEFLATDHWRFTMIAGFLPDASYMHFIEPMVTQEFLLSRKNFNLPIPTPSVLGRATSYPTECLAHYDKDADAYHIVFKGFKPIE